MKRMLPTMMSRMLMPMRMKRMVVLDGPPSEPDELLLVLLICVAVGEATRVGVTVGEAVTDGDGEGEGEGDGDGEGVAVAVEMVRALEALAFIVVSFCATAATE